MWGFDELSPGDRIRFTLSFPSCPIDNYNSSSNIGEIKPALDIDLVACGRNADTGARDCEMVSQSFDDTNEGFDFVANNNWEDFRISMVYPTTNADGQPLNTCGDFFYESLGKMIVPTYWAIIWWK